MASLASTIPRYLYLTLRIYVLRSLLLALSGIAWIFEVAKRVLLAFTVSMKQRPTPNFANSKYHVQPDYGKGRVDDVEDSEDSVSESSDTEIYPCEDATYYMEDADAVQTLASDLEFLVGALAEGIESFANGERFLVQSDDLHSRAHPSSSTISQFTSASTNGQDAHEYSAIMKPHTPKRFSLRIDDYSMRLLKYPSFNLGANLHPVQRESFFDDYSRITLISRQDRLTLASIALSTNTSATSGANDVSLSPALLWAPNMTKVKVVLALPLKRTRRKKASAVVIWSNEGEYGDLKKTLEEVGR